ncbi:GDSL-type esterase/lipase family protein [Paenibacillus gansuensis]|uniref:GDSL-type esterase/lipase family protein n=1 Tax=Paenibacillus gansuensis TaxID=306542 RepID=A0ABW5P9Y8_9BACL
MKRSRWLWGFIGLASLIATLVFVFGFVYAVNDILNPSAATMGKEAAEPSESVPVTVPDPEKEYRITALGDSLTKGTGDEGGKGYVGYVAEKLGKTTGRKVTVVSNMAVNGYVSEQLLSDLETKKGTAYAIRQANLILLTIGGNDLSQAALAQNGGRNNLSEVSGIDPEKLEKQLKAPKENVKKILSLLSEINPEAKVVYVGLYNPYYEADESRRSSVVIQKWNGDVYETVNANPLMTLVPTQDLFEKKVTHYLAADQFHPNGAGYERIADRIVQALQ